MKTRTIISILLLIGFSAYSQAWVEFCPSESNAPTYNLISSTDTLVEFNVIVPGMFDTPVDTFNRVNIKEHTRLDSVGFPEIPIVSFLVAIPDCDSINLEINPLDSSQFFGFNIYPTPEFIQDSTPEGYVYLREEFVYDQNAYSNDNWFPGLLGNEIDHGAIRDQSVIRILIYPVQFNPVKKTIKAYSEYNISITFNNATGAVNNDVGIFNEMLGNSLINYESNGLNASISCGNGYENQGNVYYDDVLPGQKLGYNCDYLIIVPDDFYNNSDMYDLAFQRANYNGFDVVITKLGAIYTAFPLIAGEEFKIKELIKNTYNDNNALNTYDNKLAYVNLVGDVNLENGNDGIPTFYDQFPVYGGYDVQFTQLTIPPNSNEPDIYPDLMIGRCSVDDDTQLQNVVTKITGFTPNSLSYKNKILTVNGTGDYYTEQTITLLGIEETINNYYLKTLISRDDFDYGNLLPSTWNIIEYDNSITNGGYYYYLLDEWKQGHEHLFLNFMGHGGPGGWSGNPGFGYNSLGSEQADILPFIISGACYTGAFQSTGENNEDCMAEEFLCNSYEMGAIGFIGSSVESSASSYEIIADYYNALLNNFSYMLGEAIMEIKLKFYSSLPTPFMYHYNLFGDPAMNIFYENSSAKPDLFIKDYHILFSPNPTNLGETITIEAQIRNNTSIEVNDPFWVKCYAFNIKTQDVTRIDAKAINGMSGNYADIQFFWNTTNLAVNDDEFNIFIEVDTAFQIDEIDEGNNLSSKELNLYFYKEGYPITHYDVDNSRPLSFNFENASASREIVYGGNMYEANGSLLISNNYASSGAVAASNLANDEDYQYLFIKSTQSVKELKVVGPPSSNPLWSYPLTTGSIEQAGPWITDLDFDGFEEIIVFEELSTNGKLSCFNHDGTLRWNYVTNDVLELIICNLNNPFNYIVTTRSAPENTYILSYKENQAQNGLIEEILHTFPVNMKIYHKSLADINKDGDMNLVNVYGTGGSFYLMSFNLTDLTFYETSLNNFSTNSEMLVCDINNSGYFEIVIADSFYETLSIYDKNLGLIGTIPVTGLQQSELSSADFNNDGLNDIVCMTKENEMDYYIEIYDYLGNQIFKKPILDKVISIWIDDIDDDNENDIIYSCGRNLYAMSVAGAGTSIGCPGFGANHRRTGVLEQPAYFTIANDTVYWSNTISLTGDHILPYGSTVVIRPGTTIKAHQNSSLLVYGELIAEGLEHHAIEFRADINNAQAGYWQGITIKNHGIVTMKNCIVRDAEIGVLFEDNNTAFFENNHMENNLEGIGAKTSSPVLKYNYISGNTIGLGSYDNASPVMAGIIQLEQHKNGIINNPTGIFIDNASIYLKSGYNDIYSNPAGNDMYIQLNFEPKPGAIKVQNNYWGTTDLLQIKNHLSPSTAFTYSPACTQSNTGFTKNSDPLFDLLGNAYSAMYSGNHTLADAYFKQLINDWPETNEAYLSVSGLFSNTKLAGQGWAGFEQYLGQLQQDTTVSENFNKLLFSYTNLCLREQERYSEAVSNYESIVLNNPTYNDSVYAVIDIGNTYEEAGSYKTSLGQLSELIPVSSAKHTEKTVDLLLSLKKEQESISQNFESDYSIESIFPNPFTNETSIKYQIADDCMVVFKVFDATGRLVLEKREYADANEEGLTRIGLGQTPPGVYYLVMECGLETRAVEKLVVK